MYSLYEMRVGEPGTDIVSLFSVAAPDARKAIATVAVSGVEDGAEILGFKKVASMVDLSEQDNSVLVWDSSHGAATNMRVVAPLETHYPGETTVRAEADLVREMDEHATMEHVIELGGKEEEDRTSYFRREASMVEIEDVSGGDPVSEDEPEIPLPVIEDGLVD